MRLLDVVATLTVALPLGACGTAEVTQASGATAEGGSEQGFAPDTDAPPVTAAEGSPLHHAQTCAQYLGPIPAMSCSDAEVMPITVNGVEVDATPETCDRPSALTGTCEAGERISARYPGHHQDGSPRPEVVFVNFCRNGGMVAIGHNASTGATCFFAVNAQDDNQILFPGSDASDYDDYWQPAELVASAGCPLCHMADPWLHSPWIDQLKDPDDLSQTLVPTIASPESPYIVVGDAFAQPDLEGAPSNDCTRCHRAQCDRFFAIPLGELVMPGPFSDSTFTEEPSADLLELRDWCETLPEVVDGNSCDPVVECIEACGESYACAGECASSVLDDATLLEAVQALLTCMEDAGCATGDVDCAMTGCPVEWETLQLLCL